MKIPDVHNLNNKMLNIEDNHCDTLGIWCKSQVNPLISQLKARKQNTALDILLRSDIFMFL